MFLRRYDADQDGKLGFWEVSNGLLPVDIRYRDDIESRQQAYDMSVETRELFKKVFRRAIDVEVLVESLRVKVHSMLSHSSLLK